jgi:hypothetical protein
MVWIAVRFLASALAAVSAPGFFKKAEAAPINVVHSAESAPPQEQKINLPVTKRHAIPRFGAAMLNVYLGDYTVRLEDCDFSLLIYAIPGNGGINRKAVPRKFI